MRTTNVGILAHVDAGKTSLTERLLHASGAIAEIGSVDAGSTQTDTMLLERRRGITIKAAVASFVTDDVAVNIIDTPGHPDFIAEVERVLGVLDGAVLVISAVEGVQAQTRILMRALQRLRIPTLLFVNKIDRAGAGDAVLRRAIAEKLTPDAVVMSGTRNLGTPGASTEPLPPQQFRVGQIDRLAEHDDALVAAFVRDESELSDGRLRDALAAQSRQALVHPLFFGSAITGAGVTGLIEGIRDLLPSAAGDLDGPVSGTVFKVARGPAGERIAYVRMFSGTIRVREQLRFGTGRNAKVTAIEAHDRGAVVPSPFLHAGQIGRLWGLGEVRIGDAIGTRAPATDEPHQFSPPTLSTVVVPVRPSDSGRMHAALVQLAEQDPLIDLRQDAIRREVSVSLYGEVQKEVVQDTLADDFGVAVTFRETTTICVERVVGTGAAVEEMGAQDNPFLATVGLRVEPAAGTEVQFRLEIELGALPLAFLRAIEETARETLQQGLYGWPVRGCTLTLARSGYSSPSSTAGDFRTLTPLVLVSALQRAGTAVLEPIHRFRLEIPADTLGPVLSALSRLQAVPAAPHVAASSYVIDGEIAAGRVHEMQRQLPGLTRGEGVLETAFASYQQVCGAIPTRSRTDQDPRDRAGYLLRVSRRVGPFGRPASLVVPRPLVASDPRCVRPSRELFVTAGSDVAPGGGRHRRTPPRDIRGGGG